MNLYIRYFDHETLVGSPEEAMDFMVSLNDFPIDDTMLGRIATFVNTNNTYPFRLKVSYNNYVLFLKTDAQNLEQFHEIEKANKEMKDKMVKQDMEPLMSAADRKKSILEALNTSNPGWYEGTINFKRVIQNRATNKCQYIDESFTARCKADSAQDCYNRLIEYLKNSKEIDPRSQYPSVRSTNFIYEIIAE